MDQRVILIYPRFADPEPIRRLRARFDPLAELTAPHMTLVFPFPDEVPEAVLRAHVAAAAAGVGPFPLRLREVTGSGEEYLFLNVKRGNDELIALHDRLYTGPLRPYRCRERTFVPHLTVGRLPDPAAFRAALGESADLTSAFETVVTEVCVDTVLPDGRGRTDFTAPLTPGDRD